MDFQQQCQKRGIEITDIQYEKLELLIKLFVQKNSEINLSAIRDEASIWEKHILDSLLPAQWIDFEGAQVLDIGAGGGFPTLPLAILNPNSKVTALDGVGKKMKAVQAMADDLNLNVKALQGRIEHFGHNPKFREQFDIVTARALAPWPVLLEYALPFVKVGGRFIAYQGPQIKEDVQNFPKLEQRLGGKIVDILETNLGEAARVFVIVEKVNPTKKAYPRDNGIPRQMPLSAL